MENILDTEIEDRKQKKRRTSLFNRSEIQNAITDYTIRDEINTQELEEYSEKLKQESDTWSTILKESRKQKLALEKKLETELSKQLGVNSLEEEDQQFFAARPDYEYFIKKVKELNNLTTIVVEKKGFVENMYKRQIEQIDSMIEQYNKNLDNSVDIEL